MLPTLLAIVLGGCGGGCPLEPNETEFEKGLGDKEKEHSKCVSEDEQDEKKKTACHCELLNFYIAEWGKVVDNCKGDLKEKGEKVLADTEHGSKEWNGKTYKEWVNDKCGRVETLST